jgi:hypothetical protein
MVPGAFVAMMIGSLLGGMVLGIFGNQLSMDTASAFLGMLTFLYVAGLIAPAKKRGTTLVFLIIISVIGVAQIAISVATGFEVLNDLSPLCQILIPAGQIFGALISKLIFNQINPKIHAGA